MRSVRKSLNWVKLAGIALAAVVSCGAHADPIKLRFASFAPDTEQTFKTVFKPFAEAVNKDSGGTVQIELFPNGALGRNPVQQPQMVLDGIADIAWIVPSFSPGRFPETEVFELPGLFRDLQEATLVFTRLMASKKINPFEQFVPLGTFTTDPYSIHSRTPIRTLADLKGRKIRVSGSIEGETLRALGAVPIGMATTEVVEAIARGTIDGTTTHPSPLFDFGFVRVVNSHYFVKLGVLPIVMLMNKSKFDSLPKPAQDAIIKHSGMWTANLFNANITTYNAELVKRLADDPKRTLVTPSAADLASAQIAFNSVIKTWTEKSPRNKQLLELVQGELAAVRAGK